MQSILRFVVKFLEDNRVVWESEIMHTFNVTVCEKSIRVYAFFGDLYTYTTTKYAGIDDYIDNIKTKSQTISKAREFINWLTENSTSVTRREREFHEGKWAGYQFYTKEVLDIEEYAKDKSFIFLTEGYK